MFNEILMYWPDIQWGLAALCITAAEAGASIMYGHYVEMRELQGNPLPPEWMFPESERPYSRG